MHSSTQQAPPRALCVAGRVTWSAAVAAFAKGVLIGVSAFLAKPLISFVCKFLVAPHSSTFIVVLWNSVRVCGER
jgi:hypothetical protein